MIAKEGLSYILLSLFSSFFSFLLTCIIAVGSVFLSMKFFDKLTTGIEEWKEIKKGNSSVALVLIAVVYSVSSIMKQVIFGAASLFSTAFSSASVFYVFLAVMLALAQILVGIIISIIAIWLTIFILDAFTADIDEYEELKKGNMAVAIMISGVLIVVSSIISGSIQKILALMFS